MRIEVAYRILGVTSQDNEKTIKKHFHKKMSRFHPDAVGSDSPEHQRKAQQINEAYTMLRKQSASKKKRGYGQSGYERAGNEWTYDGRSGFEWSGYDWSYDWQEYEQEEQAWQGEINESAFAERNIYMPYYMDDDIMEHYKTVARGRYLWDPDQEEFELMLRSLNHVSVELMEKIEQQSGHYRGQDTLDQSFSYQMRIFNSLASQYIRPVSCLRKLAQPYQVDKDGNQIYQFRALLGTRESSPVFQAMAALREGELLHPSNLQNNRIMVKDAEGTVLGHLSLEDDQLYYIIIPILREHKAQIKIQVRETHIDWNHRPYQAKIYVNLYLRVKCDVTEIEGKNQNLVLAEILQQYEGYLKGM